MTKEIAIIGVSSIFLFLSLYGAKKNIQRFVEHLKSDSPKKGYEWYIVVSMVLVSGAIAVLLRALISLDVL